MPRVYGLDDEPVEPSTIACQGIRDDLSDCILKSDCVVKYGRLPKDCLLNPDHSVPEECNLLMHTLFDCKRSMLDNRQRFRGRKGY